MKRNRRNTKAEIRVRQRAHAKRRFQERFGLILNRDRIREIEHKIAKGQSLLIVAKSSKHKNFFVEVEGKLIAVGYRNTTNRIVTALPEDYVGKLPPEMVAEARLVLLPEHTQAGISEILAGRAEELHRSGGATYYSLSYMECVVPIGYSKAKNKLVPYQPPAPRPSKCATDAESSPEHANISPLLKLDPDVAQEFRRQIQAGESRFLWRFSKTLTFREVVWGNQSYKVGYSQRRGAFHKYLEPPREMEERRSSLRLLASEAVHQAVGDREDEASKEYAS